MRNLIRYQGWGVFTKLEFCENLIKKAKDWAQGQGPRQKKDPKEPDSSLVKDRAFVSGSRVKVSLLLITMGKLAI